MKASKLSTSETVKQMKEAKAQSKNGEPEESPEQAEVKTQSKNGGPEESPEQAAQSNKRQRRTVERRTEALKSEPGHRSGTWAKSKSFQAKAACL